MANVSMTDFLKSAAEGRVIDRLISQEEKIDDLLARLSKRQRRAALGLIEDLVRSDLAHLQMYINAADPEDEEIENALKIQLEITGGAIQSAYFNEPEAYKVNGFSISDQNYRRLRLMFLKLPRRRRDLYLCLAIIHETRVRNAIYAARRIDAAQKVLRQALNTFGISASRAAALLAEASQKTVEGLKEGVKNE